MFFATSTFYLGVKSSLSTSTLFHFDICFGRTISWVPTVSAPHRTLPRQTYRHASETVHNAASKFGALRCAWSRGAQVALENVGPFGTLGASCQKFLGGCEILLVSTPDAGTSDVGTPDAGTSDIYIPDMDMPDAGMPDMGTPDVGTPDVGMPDVGMPDGGYAWRGYAWRGYPGCGPGVAQTCSSFLASTSNRVVILFWSPVSMATQSQLPVSTMPRPSLELKLHCVNSQKHIFLQHLHKLWRIQIP